MFVHVGSLFWRPFDIHWYTLIGCIMVLQDDRWCSIPDFIMFQDRHVWTIDPFIVVRAMICPIETSIGFLGCTQCRGRRRLPSSQKGAGWMLRNHQRGVFFVVLGVIMKGYEGPMCQKCMARMAILSIQLYRCGVNHFKVATSNSFRHEKRGMHLEADSRLVGAHWIIPWFFVESHWDL